jgi:hypothetical protein
VSRTLGKGQVWRLGMSASAPGKPVEGSRLIWEMNNWQYPKLADGKIQKDEPDDATADGADACDGVRYMVMTWLGPLETTKERKHPTFEQDDLERCARPNPRRRRAFAPEGSEYGDVVQEG